MPSKLYAADKGGFREVGYWRRSEQVRYWFRQRFCQGLADPENGTHFLSRVITSEDVYELYALCVEVQEAILSDHKNWEDTANRLLPTPHGVKLTDRDYLWDLEHTQSVIQRASETHTPGTEYFYQEDI